ncbi:hypothetical protein EV363DRAFT_1196895 [Boletus edulis]|nr:hypothetical protein EV363DRAFT_1196895 [Boletus edulis]
MLGDIDLSIINLYIFPCLASSGLPFTGPFSPDHLEAIIDPFHTGPLGVIPKFGSSKFCLVQDHSWNSVGSGSQSLYMKG